jgi:acyl carrier protein
MATDDILPRLNEICRQVFEKPGLAITPVTSARDIENWDSLNHVTLIMEVERKFGIKFALGELQDLKNVGSLLKLIEDKIG